jgi:hypothetical protein
VFREALLLRGSLLLEDGGDRLTSLKMLRKLCRSGLLAPLTPTKKVSRRPSLVRR